MSTISNSTRAMQIYMEHIAMASTDGRLFRKTVREQIMAETGCSEAAASTYYNNCKKAGPTIEGLGRAPVPAGLRKPGAKPKDGDDDDTLQSDNECFSVVELVRNTVGRFHSFHMQGDASEYFDEKVEAWPNCTWVLIKGLGPNPGDSFKLESGESEIKRYVPENINDTEEDEDSKDEEDVEEDEDESVF